MFDSFFFFGSNRNKQKRIEKRSETLSTLFFFFMQSNITNKKFDRISQTNIEMITDYKKQTLFNRDKTQL